MAALFGDGEEYKDYGRNFRRAFNEAKRERDCASKDTQEDKATPSGNLDADKLNVVTSMPDCGWQPEPPWFLFSNFAKLYVDPPKPDGPADRVTLTVSVSLPKLYLAIPETDDSPSLRVFARPKAAELVPDGQNMQPVAGTIAGQDKPLDNVTYDGCWQIANPEGQNANPLAGAALCDMKLVRGGPFRVGLTLQCKDLDLAIDIHNPPPDVSGKDIAVLRRVLQRMGCDDPDAAYVVLAKGGLRRGEPS